MVAVLSACGGPEIIQVSAGDDHTCVLYDDGRARCWGRNEYGNLGTGNMVAIGDDEPASAGGFVPLDDIVSITAGRFVTCALRSGGHVTCWGSGDRGRVGYGSIENVGDNEPIAGDMVVDLGTATTSLDGGYFHTCAIDTEGRVACWGVGRHGRLGYGSTEDIGDDEAPAAAGAIDLDGPAVQVVTGGAHSCALLDDGAVRCWGANHTGELGLGHLDAVGDDELPSSVTPVRVSGRVARLYAGWSHTCALLDDGAIQCWGSNSATELGHDESDAVGDDELPADIAPVRLSERVTELALGRAYTCALLHSGSVMCWGAGGCGELGYGRTELESSLGEHGPVPLSDRAVQISATDSHTCALLASGDVQCWGRNSDGQLGYGHTDDIGDSETPDTVGPVPL